MEATLDPTLSKADELRAARSWIGKPIKDGLELGKRGLVYAVTTREDEIFLVARFQGEGTRDRLIALKRRSDGHYLDPDDPRTRYRPLSEREQEEFQARLSTAA